MLVGYFSVKTQEYAREAGVSAGRMRQVEIEKALREATGRVRGTLNVELVQRAIDARIARAARRLESDTRRPRSALSGRRWCFRTRAATPTSRWNARALSAEMASLVARAAESDDVFRVNAQRRRWAG